MATTNAGISIDAISELLKQDHGGKLAGWLPDDVRDKLANTSALDFVHGRASVLFTAIADVTEGGVEYPFNVGIGLGNYLTALVDAEIGLTGDRQQLVALSLLGHIKSTREWVQHTFGPDSLARLDGMLVNFVLQTCEPVTVGDAPTHN